MTQSLPTKHETIVNNYDTTMVNLRRTIYLTLMNSVGHEEAGHKLLNIKPCHGQEIETCIMIIECCGQEKTYRRFFGLLGERLCNKNKAYEEGFEECFVKQYTLVHRLQTNNIRNLAYFYAHLLATGSLSWDIWCYIRLTEEDTTSSSRIFIKFLFQELADILGICGLKERLMDPRMVVDFESLFPRDNVENTRFAINFFTSIGLGGVTDNLREYLKTNKSEISKDVKRRKH